MRIALALLFAIASPAFAQSPRPTHVVETKDAGPIKAVLDYNVTCPNVTPTEWIVAVPLAPELPGQRKVTTTFNLSATKTKEKSSESREVFIAQVPVKNGAKSVAIQVNYEANLYSRNLRPLRSGEAIPKVTPLPEKEIKLYTSALIDIDFKEPLFQKWIELEKLQRGPKESAIEFARRTFTVIWTKFHYEYGSNMNRKASNVCGAGKSDCGGLSQLFVSTMRLHGIPARCLFGRWAESAKLNEKLGKIDYFQWHVIAEFYVDGIGWIPVDCSSAIIWEKPGTGETRNFGQQAGNFLTQHIDPDLEIDSIHFGVVKLQNIQQPTWWVRGTGKVDGNTQAEGWKVTKK